jgi:DNA-binding transcriptional MocR family regulator
LAPHHSPFRDIQLTKATHSVGQNPTSGILSLERRKDLIQVCNEYDIIVIEDEPYYYLQFPLPSDSTANVGDEQAPPFLSTLVPSCISLDTQGRVIRLDSFSKTVAPGCRLGWITAQAALIERLARITETTTQQPSGFVQSLVAELLVGQAKAPQDPPGSIGAARERGGAQEPPAWSHAGWIRWLAGLRAQYQTRMEVQTGVLAAGRELVALSRDDDDDDDEGWSHVAKTPIYSFVRPAGGMFVWLRFHFETHPLWSQYSSPSPSSRSTSSPATSPVGPARLSHALWLFWTTPRYRILVAPGAMFAVDATTTTGPGGSSAGGEGSWRFFRLTFASAPRGVLAAATQRLVDGARDFWAITDPRVVERLVEDDERSPEGLSHVDGDGNGGVPWVDLGRVQGGGGGDC